jgi:hypothetical protein
MQLRMEQLGGHWPIIVCPEWIIKGVYYLLEPCYKSSLNNLLGQKSFKRDRRIELSERYYYYYYYYS